VLPRSLFRLLPTISAGNTVNFSDQTRPMTPRLPAPRLLGSPPFRVNNVGLPEIPRARDLKAGLLDVTYPSYQAVELFGRRKRSGLFDRP
jgi:hypothetical protein